MKPFCFEQLYPPSQVAQPVASMIAGPLARSGHRIVTDGIHVYCFGGYNPLIEDHNRTDLPMLRELWKYNIVKREWTLVQALGDVPVISASHTALILGGKLLVFGGTGFPFADVKSNKLYEYNIEKNWWRIVECTGDVPGEIYGHAMIAVRNFIYIYGGTSGFVYSNEIHRLNLDTKNWEAIITPGVFGEDVPNPSYRHEIATDGQSLFIFGGGTTNTVESLQQIWVFNLDSLRWKKHATQRDSVAGYPESRKCHSCVRWKNKVYLCGGLGSEKHYDDIWSFDLKTFEWTKLQSQLPKPVYFHGAALSPNGCMFIFGGVVTVDHNTRSNELHRVWLTVPDLAELAWEALYPRLRGTASFQELAEAGVPRHMAIRRN